MGATTIEWTSAVWNPVRGCSITSPGCTNCYAMRQAHRFSGTGQPYEGLTRLGRKGSTWTGEVRSAPEMLLEPLRWKKPARIFVNSMSDLFHEKLRVAAIADCFAVMAIADWHTFQVLTKRADRMRHELSSERFRLLVADSIEQLRPALEKMRGRDWSLVSPIQHGVKNGERWPLPNVWPGVSVEDQERAQERVKHLAHTPAAVPWVSAEPLFGSVDLTRLDNGGDETYNALTAEVTTWDGHTFRTSDTQPVRWVVVGGESGPGARPMHPDWARRLRDQCVAASVPFFFKQWGGWAPISDDTPRGARLGFVQSGGHISMAISGYEPGCPCDHSSREEPMVQVGKKAAGNVLDGRTWEQFPGD